MSQGTANYPFKWINDSIHGHIMLDKFLFSFIDTPQFQRLRSLKQLGCAYMVFPGASHNRFEHSIGVCHLSGQLIEKIRSTQPELEVTQREIDCVKLAGLCHDLGHGPFSHVFDSEFIARKRPTLNWTHENASEMMLEYLVDENALDLDKVDLVLIQELIQGVPRKSVLSDEKKFLFEIVANKRNSVDVDKFDYISRDCHNVGIKSSYDFDRLMNFNRVIGGEICFHAKEVFNIYEMFHTRYSLFKRVYTHRVGKAIEFMVCDAFMAADDVLKISDKILQPSEYLHLDDGVLRDIARSTEPELKEARYLVNRIYKRDLYKFVDEIMVPKALLAHLSKEKVKPADIIAHQESDDSLTENDIIVDWLKINYALKDKNPVDHMKFFSRYNDCESHTIPKDKVSIVVPEHFEETSIRIFARDAAKATEIQAAFRKWIRKGPLSRVPNSPVTPNPVHTLPDNFASPSKHKSGFLLSSPKGSPKRQRLDFSLD